MALTSAENRKCLVILFPSPLRSANRPDLPMQEEALAVLGAVDADQTTLIRQVLTAWDAAFLDESSIDATAANKGFSTSGRRARRLAREQLVSILSYDPQPQNGCMIGRG